MRNKAGKTSIWQAIADAIRSDLAEGRYAPGDKLPTEAALAERFGVNRHTVRHGISALVEEGLIRTRRGAGAFVPATPTDYPLGTLADGQPVAVFESVFPAEDLPGLKAALIESGSVTAALNAAGVADFTRRSTRLTAVRATATQALHLQLNEGDPLLRSAAVNVDEGGTPVEYGRTWFAGDRITLTLES